MQLTRLATDDDAVSPVIGVILMVAITVLLAAVVGTFVLGIGTDQQSAPVASFDFVHDRDTGNLTITHASGNTFTLDNTASLEVRGDPVQGAPVTWSLPVESGDQLTVDIDDTGEVRIVWIASTSGKSNVVSRHEILST